MEDKILRIFSGSKNAYISGEDISRELGVSRTSIWKHIESLRGLGYEIDATPHLGYRLTRRPDRLISQEVRNNLKTRFIGKRIYAYKSLDSTNDTAYKLAEGGEKEGTVVISERQKKGKGRQGRTWVSPKGGIYLSCILKPDIEPKEVAKITLVSAVAVSSAIRDVVDVPVAIKWPNDILIKEKKVCGILTEMKAEQDDVNFVIVGIGVNVEAHADSLPKHAASVADESAYKVSKVALAKKILENLENYVLLLRKNGFDAIRDEWQNFSSTIGHHVKVHFRDEKVEGEALDVDSDGALVVRLDSGLCKRILSGDVTIVR